MAWILEIKHRSQHHLAFCRGTSCAAGSSRAVVSGRVGAHSASESQCCGTPKFKQTNHLPHLLELSEGFSLWETTCHQFKVREKRSMKRKQVLGMLRPSRALITPALPECPSVHISLVRTRVPAGILTAELKPACSKCLFVGVFSSLPVPPAVRGVGESGSLSKVRCMLCW